MDTSSPELQKEAAKQMAFTKALEDLKRIVGIVKKCGIKRVCEYCDWSDQEISAESDAAFREEWESKFSSGMPIVRDGMDGIRISRSDDDRLLVGFTNGFENPENPIRKKITEALTSEGFDVIE